MAKDSERAATNRLAAATNIGARSNSSTMFEALVVTLAGNARGIERAKLFGFDCLRSKGKVFAKVSKGRLVMKLPATRITTLIMSGQAEPYEGARGEMKEWAVLLTSDVQLATTLMDESMAFVGN